MSRLIDLLSEPAQRWPVTWEETPMERLLRLLRGRTTPVEDPRARIVRGERLRFFLTTWGARHWADRI